MPQTHHESEETRRAVTSLYLLFSRLLNEELNPELRDILLQPEVLTIFSSVDEEVGSYLNGEWKESDYEQAAVDFCDNLILPERATPPRAAAWLDDRNVVSADGIHTVVDSFIKQKQITLPAELAQHPYDHAAVLFFLAAALREIQCEQVDEFEQATLGSWVSDFGKALYTKSESPIYRVLGKLIESYPVESLTVPC